MITFKTDLILEKDTEFNESIYVAGNISGKDGRRFNLKVMGCIDAWDIDALDIDALDINAGDINAVNINAVNINAVNINARDINAVNINARDINAVNINAGNIDAWDIKAWDIKYWAVCFAYNNIKCKSIKGKREQCKEPFVLDGKIEVEEEKK